MVRRSIALLCSLVLVLSVAGPVQAKERVVAQKTLQKRSGVYLSLMLTAGHRYRIEVRSPSARPFVGQGVENYTRVVSHQLRQDTREIKLSGTTPQSFTVKQQLGGQVTGWILGLQVQLKRGTGITVRVIDTGKQG